MQNDDIPASASIRVRTHEPIGVVSPFLFGHFLEHFPGQIYGGLFDPSSPKSDGDGFRVDVIAALKNVGVPIIRWPGGCYASAYRWRWGAGPRADRQARSSTVWKFHDPHTFGTTEFVELCNRTGAEPLICVGVGRGQQYPTPDEAAAWVRYCNATEGPEAELRARGGHPEPLNVTLWGLGNEVFAGIYDDPREYGEDLVAFANAMKGADPRLRFVIVGAEREWLWDWNEVLLANDEVVRLSDWISWHDYLHTGMCESRPDGSGKKQPYHRVMEHLIEVESTIEKHARINRGLKLAVDEWNELGWELFDNIEKNDLEQTYSLGHAIYTAGFLNVLIRHADTVTMANYSPAVNTRGLIYSGHRGVLLRSTYHVYQMYRRCAGATSVRLEIDSQHLESSTARTLDAAAVVGQSAPNPRSSAVASTESGMAPSGRRSTAQSRRRNPRELSILVTNRHPSRDILCHLEFDALIVGEGRADVLTAVDLDAFNSFEAPDTVRPSQTTIDVSGNSFDLMIPARSVLVVAVPVTGE